MATVDTTAPGGAPIYRLTLESYPPDRKITVIKVIREITGLDLKEAKYLVESVPAEVVKIGGLRDTNPSLIESWMAYACAALEEVGATVCMNPPRPRCLDEQPAPTAETVTPAASRSLSQYAQDRWERASELSDLLRLLSEDQDGSWAIGHMHHLAEELTASLDPAYYRRAQEGESVKKLLSEARDEMYGLNDDDELSSDVSEAQP